MGKDTKNSGVEPSVSVIMPVYNAEAYLDESVGSVLAQTCGDFELICFNDASTDGSLALLRRFEAADSRVRVIDSAVNVKQGGGRNRALRAAHGRYVMFLDADDRLHPEAVALCLRAAEAAGSEAVFFDYERFSPSTGARSCLCQLGADAAQLTGEALRQRIISRTTPVWSAMYARDVIVSNDLFFPEGVFYEDNAVALAIQLSARNPVKINEALYGYRFDNFSVTRSANDYRFFDRIGSAVALLGHLKRLGIYSRYPAEIDWLFVNQYLIHTVYGAIYRFDRAQVDKIREVSSGVSHYVADFRANPGYCSLPLSQKIKIETHLRLPRLIKFLSNLHRRLRLK